MVVYAEYVFLENFVMNYMILSLTSRFGKAMVKKIRLALASGIGALYAFIIFFPSLHFLLSTLMKFACSLVMIIVAFSPYRFKEFFRLLGIFYLITLIFGGAGFALFYFTNFNGIVSNGIFYTTNITLKTVIIACGMGYILIHFSWGYLQKQFSKEKILTKVEIEMGGARVTLTGMVDTGNSLVDPITRYPVVIVEYDAIADLVPQPLQESFKGTSFPSFDQPFWEREHNLWLTRLRMIPFQALGTENGMLIGFKPDEVIIEKESERRKFQEIIIAIYSKKLSRSGEYRALLHPDLV